MQIHLSNPSDWSPIDPREAIAFDAPSGSRTVKLGLNTTGRVIMRLLNPLTGEVTLLGAFEGFGSVSFSIQGETHLTFQFNDKTDCYISGASARSQLVEATDFESFTDTSPRAKVDPAMALISQLVRQNERQRKETSDHNDRRMARLEARLEAANSLVEDLPNDTILAANTNAPPTPEADAPAPS
jgi:hypothetical protein